MSGVNRQTVDLSKYPDLVVIYLGMRMNMLRGLKTMIGFGPRIQQSVDAKPEGLLLHENSACASIGAISNPLSGGRARNRIASGGRTS